ncbi:maleylacetoacetate isomerase [Rhodobacterales bacterium]|nr:maleylacetoacetate isomerase [Rhodobacterales bacterium]
MPERIRLYDYWRSTASYRVRIGLNLAGLAYEAISVDLLAGEQTTPEHHARNPLEQVPVLEIDGLRLTQSLAIRDYLDDTGRLDLRPADPKLTARMRAICLAIACDIHPVCNLRVASHAAHLTGRSETRAEWMQRFIRPGLAAVETMLGAFEGPYCLGAVMSQADLVLIPHLYNAARWSVDIGDLARIAEIADNCARLPAFVAAHPDQVHAGSTD